MKKFCILFSLFIIGFVYASVPQNGVELVKVNRNENSVETRFVMPKLNFKKVNTKAGEFVKIEAGDLGYQVEYGKAQLPTASFSLMIGDKLPEVKVVSYKKSVMKLEVPVFPVQKPWPKSRKIEDRPFAVDRDYYREEKTQFKLFSLSDVYVIHGQKGITVTIHPFHYLPKKNILIVYKEVILKIKNVSGNHFKTTPVFERFYSKVFLNYFKPDKNNIKSKSASMGRILIITPADYVDTLSDFVNHKESMGYTVDVFTLDDTGTTKEEIQDFIKQRYTLVDTRPDFLILVGDTDVIPAFRCSTADNPYTDLYYTTVDGDDFFPDIACGRFSVSSSAELEHIINKTVSTEENIGNANKNALFMTADDNYQVTEGTHNYVIDEYFEPDGYNCEKIYAHSTGASVNQITQSINDGKEFVVYSGHGSPSSWYLTSSVSFTSYYVKSLLENTVYPFVYSFACQTGEYEYSECFAETWIRNSSGAATFWGSSVYSYWDEDDILERNVFKSMFEDNIYQVGPMFNAGKVYLYNYYNGGGSTKRYFQQYNLFGDPSIYVKSYKPISKGRLFLDKEAVSCEGSVNVEVWDSDLTSDTLDVTFTNLSDGTGQIVTLNKIGEGEYSGDVRISDLFDTEGGVFEVTYTDENYGGEGEQVIKKTVYLDCNPPYTVYFDANYKDATSGEVNIKFSEKCSSVNLKVFKSSDDSLVKDLTFNNCSGVEDVIDDLEPETGYYGEITVTDTLGNSYTQSKLKLFTTISQSNIESDSCDSEDDNFSHDAEYGDDTWSIVNSRYAVSNGACWYGEEKDSTDSSFLVFGPIDLPDDGDFVLSFYHTYYFEDGYDGGIVELSVDGGNSFFDAGAYMTSHGYDETLAGGLYEGRMAFTGGGFGDMVKTTVNLSPFKGKQVYVRFLCTSDTSVNVDGGGWYIDDISVDQVSLPEQKCFLINLNPQSLISVLSPEDTSLTVTLYNSQGVVAGSISLNLTSNEALHQRLDQLFQDIQFDDGPYTAFFTSTKKIGVYQMDDLTDSRGDMRDWTEACYKTTSITAPVPHIAPEINYWDTFIQIANIGESSCDFGLTYSPLNMFIPFNGNVYQPFSSKEFNVISSIFGNQWPDYKVNMANVFGKNENGFVPVAATEVFRVKDKDNSCKLTLEQSLSKKLYVAHVDNSDYWWTGIAVINPDMNKTASVVFIPYDKYGNVLDDSLKRYILDPGEKYAFVVKDEFPIDTAWFEIDSDIPVMGYELFGTMNRKLLTGLDLISDTAAEMLLPVIDSTNDWIGITVVNPFSTANTVKITCYYQGEKVFEKDITLDSNAKWVGLLSDLYQGNVDMVKLNSQNGVVSFCLEGNGHDDSTMTKVGGVKGFKVY